MIATNLKKFRVLKGVGAVLIIISIVLFLLYQILGYKYYYEAESNLRNLPTELRSSMEKLFYGNLDDNKFYNGTLAFISQPKSNSPIIWIWGKKGLRYFKVDSVTHYSNYSVCSTDGAKTGIGTVNRNSDIGINIWLDKVRQGDFVGVDTKGVFSYDWWVFKQYQPDELKETCQNR